MENQEFVFSSVEIESRQTFYDQFGEHGVFLIHDLTDIVGATF